MVHYDLVETLPKESLNGSQYVAVFTYNFPRKSWVYFMKAKSKTLDQFKVLQVQVESEIGDKFLMLRTDYGGEHTSMFFKEYCAKFGIKRQLA